MKRLRRALGQSFDRLGTRLVTVLSLALLPIGLVAVLQANEILRESRARDEAALLGDTLRAAQPALRAIERAESVAATLAGLAPALLGSGPGCSSAIATFVKSSRFYSFAGIAEPDGTVVCSSSNVRFRMARMAGLDSALKDPRPFVRSNPAAPLTDTSILYIVRPIYRGEEMTGYAMVSVPHLALASSEADWGGGDARSIATFNRRGELVTASAGVTQAQEDLPAYRALQAFVGGPAASFTAKSVAGPSRVYSVVPLIPDELYALGSQLPEGVPILAFSAMPPIVFPAIMWIVSLVVAWGYAERLVSRHIRKLGQSIISFAGGNRSVAELNVASAPLEIREVAAAYQRMTDTILHDEAELEDMVHQKEVLLREVHHRVKNNLQLIASIANMQIRQMRGREAIQAMRGLQERITALATVHRELYQTSGLADVRADELLSDITAQVIALGTAPGRRFQVKTEFDTIRLTPDQAVPVSLLLTEVLTNALKFADAPDGRPPILQVRLRRTDEGGALMEVSNEIAGPVETARESGLGAQLVQAFARQLGGDVGFEIDERMYHVCVRFVPHELAAAEARHAS